MARRKIPFLPNNYYHIYNRGANKAKIFRNDKDYVFLLKQLKEHLKEFAMTVIAYCLMSNHYHFILRQNGEAKINDFMQVVFYNYSITFNQIHHHSGTVFEGPFRAILIDNTRIFSPSLPVYSQKPAGGWDGRKARTMAVFQLP